MVCEPNCSTKDSARMEMVQQFTELSTDRQTDNQQGNHRQVVRWENAKTSHRAKNNLANKVCMELVWNIYNILEYRLD